jgi:hypothetical protein
MTYHCLFLCYRKLLEISCFTQYFLFEINVKYAVSANNDVNIMV